MDRFISGGNPHITDYSALTTTPKAPEKTPLTEHAEQNAPAAKSKFREAEFLPMQPSFDIVKDTKSWKDGARKVHEGVQNGEAGVKHGDQSVFNALAGFSALAKSNPEFMSGKMSPEQIKHAVDKLFIPIDGEEKVKASFAFDKANKENARPVGGTAVKSAKLPTAPNARLRNAGHDENSIDNTFSNIFRRTE